MTHWVYRLYDGDELIYVGRTVNLAQRIGVFQRRTGIITGGRYYPFKKLADAQAEELRLIRKYRPRFNVRVASSPTRLGQKHTEDAKRAIAAAHAGKVLSAEHRKNLWAHRTKKVKQGPDGRFIKGG